MSIAHANIVSPLASQHAHIAAAIRRAVARYAARQSLGVEPDSGGVRGGRGSVVRVCEGVRSSRGCPVGGGDVSVHRRRGFDPSVGGRRRCDARALVAHDDVLRTVIEAHGGFLFKHTGDGVCAAFASPRSAVDAAVAAQRGLELPVRMGLATGEAELRDGDYSTLSAHAGQGWSQNHKTYCGVGVFVAPRPRTTPARGR